MKTVAVIPSAGIGKRMNGIKKQLLEINGMPVIARTIKQFQLSDKIDAVIVVTLKDDIDTINQLVKQYGFTKVLKVIEGGRERQDSVYEGVKNSYDYDIIVVHDGVRPLVTCELIDTSVSYAEKYGAAATGLPLTDTIKEVNMDHFILNTPKRELYWRIQTPQAFKKEILLKAYEHAHNNSIKGTDESYLVEQAGFRVKVFQGSEHNLKITTREDINLLNGIVQCHEN